MRVADSNGDRRQRRDGRRGQHGKVWKFADEFHLPRVIVINKLVAGARVHANARGLQKKFGKNIVRSIPDRRGEGFRASSIHHDEAYLYAATARASSSSRHSAGREERSREWREKLIEKVAEGDDSLMEKFFEQGGLRRKNCRRNEARDRASSDYPVFIASARTTSADIRSSTRSCRCFRRPRIEDARRHESEGREGTFDRRPEGVPRRARVQTFSDPFPDVVAVPRYSGTLKSDTSYWNRRASTKSASENCRCCRANSRIPFRSCARATSARSRS